MGQKGSSGDGGPAATSPLPAAPAAPPTGRRYDASLVEGPIVPAVWKIAWPTVLQSLVGGLQGMVDHAMVGHYVGYTGNAAIGVSWQIFLVVVVFVSSLFTGMGVLVSRFAGADDPEKVDRTVYQAFLAAVALSAGILGPLGWMLAPGLLGLVNAAPEVQVEALPYLRIMFGFSTGTILFFMLSGALRSAGDARTPLALGVALTALNLVLNVVLIRGLGPIPAFGTAGAAMGTVIAGGIVAVYGVARLKFGGWIVGFPGRGSRRPDVALIRTLFRFGLPAGLQGVAMNLGALLLVAFVGSLPASAEAQAAFAVGYTQLFSLGTWSSVGLMSAAAAVAGQSLGAGNARRAAEAVYAAARIALVPAAAIGVLFLLIPKPLLAIFGMTDPAAVEMGVQLLRVLSVSGLFVAVALTFTGGLQGTGDTRSTFYISLVSQLMVPSGLCFLIQTLGTLDAIDIWLALLAGHITRCVLSTVRFRQGAWRAVAVEIGG